MFGRKNKKEMQNKKHGGGAVSQNNRELDTSFSLFLDIPNEKVHEISNRYISGAITAGQMLTTDDLACLSCSELQLLYSNTDWFLENVIQTDQTATRIGRHNQITFKETIIKRIKTSIFFVIYTDLTHLPYLFNNELFLVYTDRTQAEQVASHYTNEYQIPFNVQQIKLSQGDYFALPYVCGLHQFIVDGGNLIFKLDEVYLYDDSKYGIINSYLNLSMIKLTQYLYLKDDGYQFDPRVADSLFAPITDTLENSTLLLPINTNQEGTIMEGFSVPFITKRDGSKWVPLFTDQFAADQYFKKPQSTLTDTFLSQYHVFVKDDPSVVGIMMNPAREQVEFDRRKIELSLEYWKDKALCTEEHNIQGKTVRIGDPENADRVREWVKNLLSSIPQVTKAYLRYMLMDNQISYLLLVALEGDKSLLMNKIRSSDLSVLEGRFIDTIVLKDETRDLTGNATPFFQK